MRYLSLLLAMMVSSCAGVYQNPSSDPSQTATLNNSMVSHGAYNWESFTVNFVDGKRIIYRTLSTEKRIVLPAGEHRLFVEASYRRKLSLSLSGSGPYAGLGEVRLKAEAGHTYTLTGRVDGERMFAWVIDNKTGKRVTDESVVSIRESRVDNYPVYIPIIVR